MPPPDFNRKTVENLAKSASYQCNNPVCRLNTLIPGKNGLPIIKGQASHIKGARPGTARYDPNMTDEERADISNGIWLCSACHDSIDKPAHIETAPTLHEWKERHTGWLRNCGEPELPQLSLEWSKDLDVLSILFSISAEKQAKLCQWKLKISNSSGIQLDNFTCTIESPERMQPVEFNGPSGLHESFKQSPRNFQFTGGMEVPKVWGLLDAEIKFASLPARSTATYTIWSLPDKNASDLMKIIDNIYHHRIRGRFQFKLYNEAVDRFFINDINYDSNTREVKLAPTRIDDGTAPMQYRMMS